MNVTCFTHNLLINDTFTGVYLVRRLLSKLESHLMSKGLLKDKGFKDISLFYCPC